jgi:hypothetical protein
MIGTGNSFNNPYSTTIANGILPSSSLSNLGGNTWSYESNAISTNHHPTLKLNIGGKLKKRKNKKNNKLKVSRKKSRTYKTPRKLKKSVRWSIKRNKIYYN